MNKNFVAIAISSLFVVGLIYCLSIILDNSAFIDSVEFHSSQDNELYKIVRVIDGDTIVIKINDKAETVRLIGINTPETVDPRRPVECFGIEASNRAKEILSGKSVRLEEDDLVGKRDKYGRLLKYIFLENGTNFNKTMISEGYAYEYTYDLPYKYQSEFKQAEKEAKEMKKGLWAQGVCEN